MRVSLITVVLLLTLAASATAQTATSAVDEAAQALRSDPVYVDPDADPGLSRAEAADLRRQVQTGKAGPVFIAVLANDAGDPSALITPIHDAVGRRGTYVVTAGRSLRAGSDFFRAGPLATAAVARGGSLSEILDRMVTDIAQARLVGPSSSQPPGEGSGGQVDPGGGDADPGPSRSGALVLLGVLALGGGGLALVSRARRRRQAAAELEHVKDQVRDDLVDLGEGIRALDVDIQMPSVTPEARADYERAVEAYDRANTAWNTARSVDDLQPVGSALEEGRWALQSARARLEGRTPPQRTAPCFFDPRHGPSSREVEWAPPGGTPRPVPACEADAQAVDRGDDPGFREVQVGGQLVPYWGAGPAYSPFYGRGMFGGFGGLGLAGGLLGGLMLGEMLDGPDIAYGDAGGWGDGDDGGDFGGGDFGGGDFGGGDFGGGGFGGGDF